jgi:hypothetical protein
MKRFIYIAAVAVVFTSVIGCAHKRAKRVTSACYADCCSPCACCDGIVAPLSGPIGPAPLPVLSPQAVGGVAGPFGRRVAATPPDTATMAALPTSAVVR